MLYTDSQTHYIIHPKRQITITGLENADSLQTITRTETETM